MNSPPTEDAKASSRLSLEISGVSKSFGRFPALNDVSLQAKDKEFLALLGPSGSGKTTLLRVLAGLERPDAGEVRFDGEDFLSIPVRRRKVGMVFQHYALFRHMTVAQNIAFGLTVRPRRERPSKSETGLALDAGHIWVPIDDHNTMVYNWSFLKEDGELTEEDRLERTLGNGPMHVDQTTFRSYANRANNYLLDRDVQRNETFTGIEGINAQDRAIQESMGQIVDRSREHLGPADKAIIQLRKKLRDAVRAVEAGANPDGLGTTYYDLRAGEGVLPREADWRQELTPTMRPEQILQTV